MNENLVCSNCGTYNTTNTKFCIKCGNNLQSNFVETINVSSMNAGQNISRVSTQQTYNGNSVQQTYNGNSTQQTYNGNSTQQTYNNPTQQPTYNNASVNKQVTNTATDNLNYLQFIVGALLKPFDSFKKDEEKLSNFKNVGILSGIVVGIMTLIGLFQTMLTAVRVKSLWTGKVEWIWENLKGIEYFKVVGQSLLIYVGILIAISGIYFLASLVIKKETKFVKLLGATVTAFIPFMVASSILSPVLSLIYSPLGLCVTIVGFVYALIILLELMNELIKIENKNSRIYFHSACLSILIIGGGFIAYKLILGSLTSGLGGLSSLLR